MAWGLDTRIQMWYPRRERGGMMPVKMEIKGEIVRTLCVCRVCGYEWPPLGDKLPIRCARKTCRSPYWNENGNEPR